MDTLNTHFGWLILSISAIFTVGLAPHIARRFYPSSPNLKTRLAAPLVFAGLAAASFMGFGVPTLILVVILGMTQIIVSRRKGRNQKPAI